MTSETAKPNTFAELISVLGRTWPLVAHQRRALSKMVFIGMAASLAESLGIAVVLTLVYALISNGQGPFSQSAAVGMKAHLFDFLAHSPVITALIIVALVALKGVLMTAYETIAHRIGAEGTEIARNRIYSVYLNVPYIEIAGNGAELLHTALYEAESVSRTVVNVANVFVNVGAILVFTIYISMISSILGATSIVLGLVLIGGAAFWMRGVMEAGAALNAVNDRLMHRLLLAVYALRTIRLTRSEAYFMAEFEKGSSELTRSSEELVRADQAGRPIRDLGLLLTMAVFLYLANRSGIPLNKTITVVALLYRLMPHFTHVENLVRALVSELSELKSAVTLIERDVPRDSGRSPYNGFFHVIQLDNVGFTFAGNPHPSLINVEMPIERGTLTVINGVSGSGKTTLLNIIAGLLEPTTGSIMVQGQPLSSFDRTDWYSHLGCAGQDIELIDADLRDNIRIGREGIDDALIREVLELCEASEFMEHGGLTLDSPLGDRGMRMSGGQRQRIGLARALVNRPDLLLLDEALNAVDLEMEDRILARIRAWLPETTIVIVTHRDNIADADNRLSLNWGWPQLLVVGGKVIWSTQDEAQLIQ